MVISRRTYDRIAKISKRFREALVKERKIQSVNGETEHQAKRGVDADENPKLKLHKEAGWAVMIHHEP